MEHYLCEDRYSSTLRHIGFVQLIVIYTFYKNERLPHWLTSLEMKQQVCSPDWLCSPSGLWRCVVCGRIKRNATSLHRKPQFKFPVSSHTSNTRLPCHCLPLETLTRMFGCVLWSVINIRHGDLMMLWFKRLYMDECLENCGIVWYRHMDRSDVLAWNADISFRFYIKIQFLLHSQRQNIYSCSDE